MSYQYRGKVHDANEPLPTPTRPRKLDSFDPSACGTYAGYRRHQTHNVPPCDDCRAAQADYSRDRYHATGGEYRVGEFNPERCGTYSGYKQHALHKQSACDQCRAANSAYIAAYRARTKEAA